MVESNSQRIAKNTGLLFIRTLLILFVGLYTSRVILRVLGFDDFGILNVVGSVVILFSFLKNALTNATYRYLAYEIGKNSGKTISKVYSMAINVHALLAIILFVILEIGGVWFVNNKLNISSDRIYAANWVFQFSLLTFCVSILQTPFNSNIIAHEKMNFYAFISIIEAVLKLVVVFMLIQSPIDKLISYSILLFIVSVVILLLYIYYCSKTFRDCNYYSYWNIKFLKKFSSYSGWSLLVNTVDIVTQQSISIFFNLFLGVIANAALGIANQVTSQVNTFLGTFTQAFNPQIIKSYASKDLSYFYQLLYSACNISFMLLLLLSVPVIVNIKYLLFLWLGDFPPQTPSYVIAILIFLLIDSLQAPLWQAVHATGNLKTHQLLMSSIKVLSIPLFYLALNLGYDGCVVLYIWVIVNFSCAVVRTIYMKKLINLSLAFYLRDVILKILTLSIVVVPLPIFVSYYIEDSMLSFFLSSVISVLLICSVGYFYCLNQKERNIVDRAILDKLYKKRRNR